MDPRRGLLMAGATAATLAWLPAQSDPDSDGDGLADFQEVHKYLTDPHRSDSDSDGIADGDWLERREYQYTVRTIVQVMRPVTIDTLCDDYQDARVLDETPTYVELEVIHYPFNTVASAITADAGWRHHTAGMRQWLAPGPTSDWNASLRAKLLSALKKDGINARKLDDKTLVERASEWLLQRARYQPGFTAFLTAFDAGGKPFVPEALLARAKQREQRAGTTLEEQWAREISARGMFRNRVRGSCSSSAIYLSGCLRALGIPTRTVLVVPVIDANDDREVAMLQRLEHSVVRRDLLAAAQQRRGKWASHTFNEVFVGGRWRRLNYDRLGQNIYDRQLFGLATHIATFRDWADAKMPETMGKRHELNAFDDVFGGPDPYSTISLRDEFGAHCNAEAARPPALQARVTALTWGDDAALPANVRQWFAEHRQVGLVARIEGPRDGGELRDFLAAADPEVHFTAPSHPPVDAAFEPRCWWWKGDHALVLVRLEANQLRALAKGVAYGLAPSNGHKGAAWELSQGLHIERR